MSYTETTLQLSPGDSLLMYTDGATDALNEQGVPFGLPRLEGSLASSDHGAPDLLERLKKRPDRMGRRDPAAG